MTIAAVPPAQVTPPPAVPPVEPPPAAPPAAAVPPVEPVVPPVPPVVAPPAAAPPAPPAAPVTYDLVLPEGGYVDDADMVAVTTHAKAQGWTNDQAQGALDDHAAALAARSVTFLAELTADPTYGGAKLAQTQQRANAALEKVRPAGTPRGDALRRLLDKSGYGNHIEVVSLWADLGALMAEDTPTRGGGGGGGKEYNSPEDLYRKTATG